MTRTQTLERNPSDAPASPGPAHERLNVFAGRWKLEGLQHEGPDLSKEALQKRAREMRLAMQPTR